MNNYTFWTENELNLLKQWSGKISFEKMTTYFINRTACSLLKKSRKLGLISNYRHKKYFLNKTYWNQLNLINCYYAGFIAADGNLASSRKTLTISLNPKDISILEDFKKEIEYNGTIKVYQKEKYKKYELQDVCTLAIDQVGQFYEDLNKHFNIVPCKSKILLPPNINNHFLEMAYIIGLIDGDGWIIFGKRKSLTIGFVSGSEQLINWVYNKLKLIINNDIPKICKPKNRNYWYFTVNDRKAAILINYLSKLPISKLARKWENPEILHYIQDQKIKNPHLFIEPDAAELSKYLPINNLNTKNNS